MTQVEEAFTDTTMEKPAGFLDSVKRIRQLEPQASSGETREPALSAETLMTTGRSGPAATVEAVAPGKAWLPQSCRGWHWSHGEPAIAGGTTGRAGVAVTVEAGTARLPQNCFVVQQEGRNVVFHFVSYGSFVASSFKIEHPIILELYELLKDDSDDEIVPKRKSVEYAINFARNILEEERTNPILDLHPDGEISMTWRKPSSGIINIAFREDGVATYASYLALSKETRKGRFVVSSVIPADVIEIIEQIEKS